MNAIKKSQSGGGKIGAGAKTRQLKTTQDKTSLLLFSLDCIYMRALLSGRNLISSTESCTGKFAFARKEAAQGENEITICKNTYMDQVSPFPSAMPDRRETTPKKKGGRSKPHVSPRKPSTPLCARLSLEKGFYF